MHELSLAQSIFEVTREATRAEGSARVTLVVLELGALGHVEPSALELALEAVFEGTVAEGARVQMRTVPGRGLCVPCGLQFEVSQRGEPCPHCGGYEWVTVAGEDLRLVELEVE